MVQGGWISASTDPEVHCDVLFQSRASNIKRERRGIRHIQALDLTRQVEPRDLIAGLAGKLAQTFAFGAKHERKRRAQGGRRQVAVAAGIEADQQEAALFKCREAARQILYRHQRHQFERAGGRFGQHPGCFRVNGARW